jgi:hypothetical protein
MYRDMAFTKVARAGDTYRWGGVASDDRVDIRNTRLDLSIFQDFIANSEEKGMPFLNVAHYQDGRVGVAESMYIDGNKFRMGGVFDAGNPLADAMVKTLLADRQQPEPKVKESVGFYPRAVAYEDNDVLAYLKGWLEHTAGTVIPVNPRTDLRLVMQASGMTRVDDAAAIVGPELAAALEKMDRSRRAVLEGRSLAIPDAPVGSKTESILGVLSAQLCVQSPLILFSAVAPEPPSPRAPRPFLIDPDVERWLERTRGPVDLASEPISVLARQLLSQCYCEDATISDGDVIALFSTRPSYAYLSRLVDILKGAVNEDTFAQAHKVARGHAGGVAYPSSATAISVADFPNAKPTSKLSDLTSGDKVASLVRAFTSIYEANEKDAALRPEERYANVIFAAEELKRALVRKVRRSEAVELADVFHDVSPVNLRTLADEALLDLHTRVHRQHSLAALAGALNDVVA